MPVSNLPFVVSLWSEDELRIESDLARVVSLSLGRLMFDGAAVAYPHRMVTLRGPGVCEVRAAGTAETTPAAIQARRARAVATAP
ncbi:MAG TPA: hypothetical protein VIL09_12735 [Microvirga sp.]|jgi:hypothetical protein